MAQEQLQSKRRLRRDMLHRARRAGARFEAPRRVRTDIYVFRMVGLYSWGPDRRVRCVLTMSLLGATRPREAFTDNFLYIFLQRAIVLGHILQLYVKYLIFSDFALFVAANRLSFFVL